MAPAKSNSAGGSSTASTVALLDNPQFLQVLALQVYDAATDSGAITNERKELMTKGMGENGFPMTWNALRQHVQKLRKKREGGDASGSQKPTPQKPTTTAKKPTPSSARGKKAALMAKQEDDDDFDSKLEDKLAVKREAFDHDMFPEESPLKRAKSAAPQQDDEI